MTRDEAVQKLAPGKPCSLTVSAAKFVDRAEKLGLLKLDDHEAETNDVLARALSARGVDSDKVFGALAARGLKVVRA